MEHLAYWTCPVRVHVKLEFSGRVASVLNHQAIFQTSRIFVKWPLLKQDVFLRMALLLFCHDERLGVGERSWRGEKGGKLS